MIKVGRFKVLHTLEAFKMSVCVYLTWFGAEMAVIMNKQLKWLCPLTSLLFILTHCGSRGFQLLERLR